MKIKSNMTIEDLLPYCVFPNSFIRNGKIPPQQKVLFEILCSYDHAGVDGTRKGWCDPSLDKIAEQMGLKKRAVQTHLKRLVESGMVVVVYRNLSLNESRTSIYILNILPGLNESDLKRIALTRNIEIKHLLSGLNTIKVQTAQGMFNVAEEQFDLEYLITGKRSSTILQADRIATPEEIISDADEKKIREKDLYGYPEPVKGDDVDDDFSDLTFSNKRVKRREKGPGWNSDNYLDRIVAGNYEKITSKEICGYFKYLYDLKYPLFPYTVNTKNWKDLNIIRANLEKFELDLFIPLIEYFIKNYERLFYNDDYPRPAIWQLSQAWIINKVTADFDKNQVNEEKLEVANERPDTTVSKTIIV